MSKRTIGLAVTCAALSALADNATVSLTANDGSEDSAFTQGMHWSDNKVPHSGADYTVANGRQMRSPNGSDASYTFGGDSLTLLSGAAGICLRTKYDDKTGKSKVIINDLRIQGGGIWNGIANTVNCLDGNITVLTPVGSPGSIGPATADRGIILMAPLHGEVGTQLTITAPGTVDMRASNSDYRGSLVFDGGGNWSLTCRLARMSTLGAPLETFDEKATIIKGGAKLQFQNAFMQSADGDNRGIWLENGGGAMSVSATSELYSPISGDGQIIIQKGNYVTLRYGGTMTGNVGFMVQGKLQLLDSFAMSDDSRISLDGEGQLTTMTANPVTVKNFTYYGGTIVVVGRIDFRGRFVHADEQGNKRKIGLSLASLPSGSGTAIIRVPALTVPASSCVVTKDDFTLTTVANGVSELVEDIEVVTDGETGIQTVNLLVQPYVTATAANPALCNNAGHWSNGQVVGPGNNYLASQRNVRYGGPDGGTYTFPGNSLTLFNPYGGYGNFISYVVKQAKFVCNDFRAMNWTGLTLGGVTGRIGEQQTIAGNIHVLANTGYMTMNGAIDRHGVVEATVSGTGGICLIGDSVYDFRADNSGYGGSFRVIDGATLTVGDEKNLGGELTKWVERPLMICTNNNGAAGIFRPSKSMTIANPNRTVELFGRGCVITDEGVELTTLSRIRPWDGVKRGKGTWTLGGAAETSGGRLRVEEGVLKIANADAIGNNALTFADGAELAVAVDTGDAKFEQIGLLALGNVTVEGEGLTVRVARPRTTQKVAVMTLPDDKVEAVRAKLHVKVGKRKADAPLEIVPVTVSGTTYSCISAEVVNGTTIIIL